MSQTPTPPQVLQRLLPLPNMGNNSNHAYSSVVIPPIKIQHVLTENGTLVMSKALNGFQGFCSANAEQICPNQTVSNCPACSVGLYAWFIALVAIFGIAVLFGNLMIIWIVWKKKKTSKLDILKVSLAIADLLTGK